VHDPATLIVALARVAGNKGANTPGVDGVTAEYVEKEVGAPGFLDDLRAALKDGSFRPKRRGRARADGPAAVATDRRIKSSMLRDT
jgi:retron-type reverse transcriptase